MSLAGGSNFSGWWPNPLIQVSWAKAMRRLGLWAVCLSGWLLVGCGANATELPTEPTVMPIFQDVTRPTATPTVVLSEATPTTPPPVRQGNSYHEVFLYNDGLGADWSLASSTAMRVEPLDTSHWFETLDPNSGEDAGAVTLAVKPEEAWGELYFTLRPTTTVSYPRGDVQGVSFWLNSGDGYLSNDALVITVVGSNDHPYWVADDMSALTEMGYFPEIPLYDLAINDAIPPNTWVKVVLSMDKLLFGPDYTYVTGVYIKNKSFYENTFYLDRVALLVTDK